MTSSPSTLSRAERKKLEMRQEILDAAFACFSEQGYHATGVADIAGRIGIGHGTFYRYFKSKRDIIEHVIDDVTEQIFQAIGA
ncbi:TetR/AcrR family transcriptional regulator, partial [Mycobacteroides chelonae]